MTWNEEKRNELVEFIKATREPIGEVDVEQEKDGLVTWGNIKKIRV